MKAIKVKYLGPTNYRGSRYRASAGKSAVEVGYNHSIGDEANARRAATALLKKVGHSNYGLVGGTLGKSEYVYVMIPRRKFKSVLRRSR